MSDQIVHTTDAAFEQDVVKSQQPVLLDFWAEWCGPCKMIAPILDTIATQYKDKLRVVKLNIDENPKTPPKFNIRGIPTLLLLTLAVMILLQAPLTLPGLAGLVLTVGMSVDSNVLIFERMREEAMEQRLEGLSGAEEADVGRRGGR